MGIQIGIGDCITRCGAKVTVSYLHQDGYYQGYVRNIGVHNGYWRSVDGRWWGAADGMEQEHALDIVGPWPSPSPSPVTHRPNQTLDASTATLTPAPGPCPTAIHPYITFSGKLLATSEEVLDLIVQMDQERRTLQVALTATQETWKRYYDQWFAAQCALQELAHGLGALPAEIAASCPALTKKICEIIEAREQSARAQISSLVCERTALQARLDLAADNDQCAESNRRDLAHYIRESNTQAVRINQQSALINALRNENMKLHVEIASMRQTEYALTVMQQAAPKVTVTE